MLKPTLLRITTVPISMNILLKGQLKFMNNSFDVIGATSYDDKHFNEVSQREGIEMHRIEMKRTIAPLQDLKSLWQMYKLMKKIRPQIVHTHTPKAGLIGMIAAYAANVPIRMHTVAGMPLVETKGARRSLLNFIEKLTYSCAHKIYPNSLGLQQIILENNFCNPKKLQVIANGSSNGINTDHFQSSFSDQQKLDYRESINIAENDIVFTFIGRLCIEKGISELIEAFLQIVSQNPNKQVKLLLVGPLEKENGALPQQVIEQINSIPQILPVGRHDDIRPYLEISDIFVFPSYREGFPNVVLQAGAMGLPCIVSDINGCNEIIIPNHNGLIVPVRNNEKLFLSMQDLLENDSRRQSLAANSRRDVVSKYSQQIVWTGLLAEYERQLQIKNVHV